MSDAYEPQETAPSHPPMEDETAALLDAPNADLGGVPPGGLPDGEDPDAPRSGPPSEDEIVTPLPDMPPGDDVDTPIPDYVDSEPRRKWTPNAELIRALADARKDLKPGEASLFWDWTATRDSAPPAEDVRPSGEGEVLISDKDAAAAYVAPVKVAPAVPPRSGTKSRIRVREDVDPRRQPTVKTARASDPAARPAAAHHAGESVRPAIGRPSAPSFPPDMDAAPGRSSSAPIEPPSGSRPTHGQERRRRLAWAIFFGTATGVIVFFWLHFPRQGGRFAPAPAPTFEPVAISPVSPVSPPNAMPDLPRPLASATPVGPVVDAPASASASASAEPDRPNPPPTAAPVRENRADAASSAGRDPGRATGKAPAGAGRPPAPAQGLPAPQTSPSSPQSSGPSGTAVTQGDLILIRKKKDRK